MQYQAQHTKQPIGNPIENTCILFRVASDLVAKSKPCLSKFHNAVFHLQRRQTPNKKQIKEKGWVGGKTKMDHLRPFKVYDKRARTLL
jgi:hypothetical protein